MAAAWIWICLALLLTASPFSHTDAQLAANALLLFAALVALANWSIVIQVLRTRKSSSMFPFVSGVAGLLAYAIYPPAWRWCLLLLLDPGNAVLAPLWLLGRMRR